MVVVGVVVVVVVVAVVGVVVVVAIVVVIGVVDVVGVVGQHSQLIAKEIITCSLVLTTQNCVPSLQGLHSWKPGSFDAVLHVIPAES